MSLGKSEFAGEGGQAVSSAAAAKFQNPASPCTLMGPMRSLWRPGYEFSLFASYSVELRSLSSLSTTDWYPFWNLRFSLMGAMAWTELWRFPRRFGQKSLSSSSSSWQTTMSCLRGFCWSPAWLPLEQSALREQHLRKWQRNNLTLLKRPVLPSVPGIMVSYYGTRECQGFIIYKRETLLHLFYPIIHQFE